MRADVTITFISFAQQLVIVILSTSVPSPTLACLCFFLSFHLLFAARSQLVLDVGMADKKPNVLIFGVFHLVQQPHRAHLVC